MAPLDRVLRQFDRAIGVRDISSGVLRANQASNLEPKDESELNSCTHTTVRDQMSRGLMTGTYVAACRWH